MGAWGPGLYHDDVAEDVKTEYLKLLKTGKSNKEATEKLLEDNQSIINDSDEASVFWFALADTQWKLGRLIPSVKDKALFYLKTGDDLKKWEKVNNTKYKDRKNVLEKLETRLNSSMPSLRKVPVYKYYKCNWNIGDTYAYRLESDHAQKHNLYGHYLIVHKINDFQWIKGDDFDLYPVVYTKITRKPELPKTTEDINNDSDFVRYVRSPIYNMFKYKSIFNTMSSKTLRKLVFIGNHTLERPKDEFIERDFGLPIEMKKLIYFEKEKIDMYLYFKSI